MISSDDKRMRWWISVQVPRVLLYNRVYLIYVEYGGCSREANTLNKKLKCIVALDKNLI